MGKFPERPNSLELFRDDPVWQRILNQEHGVCDCGHADFDHKITDWNKESIIQKPIFGECETCMCPFFKEQHKATYRQILGSHK